MNETKMKNACLLAKRQYMKEWRMKNKEKVF